VVGLTEVSCIFSCLYELELLKCEDTSGGIKKRSKFGKIRARLLIS